MIEYRGFHYWLVETKTPRIKVWRIQYPDGRKTPPFESASEAYVKLEIDQLIAASVAEPHALG